MKSNSLFHISESANIRLFEPKPSPSHYEHIKGDVVFAISENLLHNYLLPRDCPRVAFYMKHNTSDVDKEKFFGERHSDYVVAVEKKWEPIIKQTTLYCYELPSKHFTMLDVGAGYYISYKPVTPISVRIIPDIFRELLERNVELRFLPSLLPFASEVSKSTLQFSLIRMRNATA